MSKIILSIDPNDKDVFKKVSEIRYDYTDSVPFIKERLDDRNRFEDASYDYHDNDYLNYIFYDNRD